MRQFFIIYLFLLVLTLTVLGFRGCKSQRTPLEFFPDMDRQAKFQEQGRTSFFPDGRMDRPPVPGTVPFVTALQEEFNHLAPDNRFREDAYIVTGRIDGNEFGTGIPVELNQVNMLRGQELYNIHCAICHGRSGNGLGVVAAERYGYATIISILQQRVADQPDGEIYNTIANGKNTMFGYGSKIRVEDRWKVVMYVRALQRAGNATTEDVPADRRGELGL
jgi:hypothetical protein